MVIKWLNDWDNEEENIIVDIIGKCSINNYGGILTPQIIILFRKDIIMSYSSLHNHSHFSIRWLRLHRKNT